MMSLTLRLHTPPLAFWSLQNIWLAFVSGPASGAKTPDRSVRTPSVIVLSATPGPALIEPEDPPPDVLDEPLLPQAASDNARASPTAATRSERFMTCSPLLWVGVPGSGGSALPGHPRRRSVPRPPRRRTGSGRRPRTAGRCCRAQRAAAGLPRNATRPVGGR